MAERFGHIVVASIACTFIALVGAGAATSVDTLDCDRAAGTCTMRRSSIFSKGETTFRVGDVREVRFVDGLGKNKRDAQSVLVFASGSELRTGSEPRSDARKRNDVLARYFAGGDPTLHDEKRGSPLAGVLALAAAVGAVIFAFRAKALRKRDREAGLPPVPSGDLLAQAKRPVWKHPAFLFAVLIAVAVAVQAVFMTIASQSQGTLTIECRGRCRFQGGECLPGGSVQIGLPPGSYSIDLWTPKTTPPWTPRETSVRLGETTRFECPAAPP